MDTDKAVKAILADVTDRRGWRQAWDMFDEDIKEEIKAEWKRILDGLNHGTDDCPYDCGYCHPDDDDV